jgi:hypothetical protein
MTSSGSYKPRISLLLTPETRLISRFKRSSRAAMRVERSSVASALHARHPGRYVIIETRLDSFDMVWVHWFGYGTLPAEKILNDHRQAWLSTGKKAGDLTRQEYRDAAKSEVDRSVENERNEIMLKRRSAGAGSAIPVDDQVDEGVSKSPT